MTGAASPRTINTVYTMQMAVKRIYRQHNSVVVVVPVAVREALGLKKGDYVSFSWDEGATACTLAKVEPREVDHGEDA